MVGPGDQSALLRRYDRNQGERIQLCISTVLVWESGGRLHKMCIGVGWFEVRLGRCLSGNRSQLGTNRHDRVTLVLLEATRLEC